MKILTNSKIYMLFILVVGFWLPGTALAVIATDLVCVGCVQTADIANNSITSAKIRNFNVKAADLAPNSVTSAAILNYNVKAADLAPNSVTSAAILNGNVKAADLAPNSVTSAAILNNNVKAVDLGADAKPAGAVRVGNQLARKVVTSLTGLSATITAPAAGQVLAIYEAECLAWPHIPGTDTIMAIGISTVATFIPTALDVNSKRIQWGAGEPRAFSRRSCTVSALLPVAAGITTVYMRANHESGGIGSSTWVDSQRLNLLYVPALY